MEIKPYLQYNESEILPLYRAVGWSNYYEYPRMLRKAYQNSLCILGAYQDGGLVGILRAVGDGASVLLIQDILVHPAYQRRGIGTKLMQTVLEEYKNVYQVQLMTDDTEKTVAFYKSLGFRPVQEYGGCGFMRM